jgi:hypothetical protein
MFAALEANRFDVVANQVTITPERQQKYDMSKPYSIGEGVIVTRAIDNSIKSLADLKGKVAGETITSNWAQVARDAGARVEAVEGFAQAITLLNRGRVGGLRAGDHAAESGPRRRGHQRQHRRVRLPRRNRRQVGEDRREDRREE